MHAVTCPQCKRVYQSDRLGPETQVRCTRCGTVFLASPGRPQQPAAPEDALPARPARPHMYHRTRRRVAGPWTAVVTLVFLGAAVALGVVLWFQFKARRPQPVVTSQPAVLRPRSRPARATDWRTRRLFTGRIVRKDPNVGIDLTQIRGDVPGHRIVVGVLHNHHDYALLEAQVTITARSADAKSPRSRSVVCQFIPSGGRAGFSTEFLQLPQEKDLGFTAVVDTAGAGPKTVCEPIDPLSCRVVRDKAERRIVVTGEVRNHTDATWSNVRIYCDFFTSRGEWRAEAVGALTSAQGVGPNGTAAFRAVMDGKSAAILVETISDRPAIRLVATKQ